MKDAPLSESQQQFLHEMFELTRRYKIKAGVDATSYGTVNGDTAFALRVKDGAYVVVISMLPDGVSEGERFLKNTPQ